MSDDNNNSPTNETPSNPNKDKKTAIMAASFLMAYRSLSRQQCRLQHTSILIGHKNMLELLNGHPQTLFDQIRMYKDCFHRLCAVLKDKNFLKTLRHVTVEEQVLIFLTTIAHCQTNRRSKKEWQHLGEIVSRYVRKVCKAVCKLSPMFIRAPNFNETPEQIRSRRKYFPWFENCVGAIDGTHVAACVPAEVTDQWRGRHKICTQNVMAVCSFDMHFTYIVIGWEGTAHDSRILRDTIADPDSGFPRPPPGYYYLVDAGYANEDCFLAPYRNKAYHLKDCRRLQNGRPTSYVELFNYTHSSLKNCIEHSFGVLKARFHILKHMTNYPIHRQAEIPKACCVIHNFIKKFNSGDPLFNMYDVDDTMLSQIEGEDEEGDGDEEGESSNTQDEHGANDMPKLREYIAKCMWAEFERNP
ncbi:hypothetical protein UlMin_033871 [Ulmus minor]